MLLLIQISSNKHEDMIHGKINFINFSAIIDTRVDVGEVTVSCTHHYQNNLSLISNRMNSQITGKGSELAAAVHLKNIFHSLYFKSGILTWFPDLGEEIGF